MKKLLVLLFIPAMLWAQRTPAFDDGKIFKDTVGTKIKAIKAVGYKTTTVDTTIGLNTIDWNKNTLAIQTRDTATFLIYVQYSLNDSTWTTESLIDSLQTQDSAGTVKTVDMSSRVLGIPWMRFILKADVNSFSWSDLSRKMWTVGILRRPY